MYDSSCPVTTYILTSPAGSLPVTAPKLELLPFLPKLLAPKLATHVALLDMCDESLLFYFFSTLAHFDSRRSPGIALMLRLPMV